MTDASNDAGRRKKKRNHDVVDEVAADPANDIVMIAKKDEAVDVTMIVKMMMATEEAANGVDVVGPIQDPEVDHPIDPSKKIKNDEKEDLYLCGERTLF
eukprot:CAMPEP_0116843328 /NCGR_PEP_ID=MMETSP0418-20121206/12025_1 /TAXON_ID=1158023 /ORGANISM="Astrosyne radiata, Strain 13vi08-1A" /LENGTH=98 /DNA_ID=CAMNT_0004474065 /DNA_START=242 /DNA_END=538 /DNA_ORIENTATION=+